MDDDFNTARAIGYIFDAIRLINTVLADRKAAVSPAVLAEGGKILREVGAVLGLFGEEPDAYLCRDREREAAKRGLSIVEIESRIAERRAAREAREWQKADDIRQDLAAKGVILKDSPTATTWSIT